MDICDIPTISLHNSIPDVRAISYRLEDTEDQLCERLQHFDNYLHQCERSYDELLTKEFPLYETANLHHVVLYLATLNKIKSFENAARRAYMKVQNELVNRVTIKLQKMIEENK